MFSKFHSLREKRDERGFTLIELLVVILIIAILAAIAIPVFLNQRKKGYVSAMEAAAKNASTAAESYATSSSSGNYTGMTESSLTTEGWRYASTVNVVSVDVDSTGNLFCVAVSHDNLDATYLMGIDNSQNTKPTKALAAGGCANGVLTPADWTP